MPEVLIKFQNNSYRFLIWIGKKKFIENFQIIDGNSYNCMPPKR